jgi:predicted enzyme related to lactoylglutathione lyase
MGPFQVMEGNTLPPTNRKVTFPGVTIFAIEYGKVNHARVIADSGSLMRQLGAMPGSERAAPPSMYGGREIVHLEIPATDRKAAAHFYGELFGWEYEHLGEPMNYTTFKTGTVEGGFPDVSEMNPAGEVIFYINSKDIDSDVRRAESMGGKTIVPRTEIPGMGWFAILTDPSGNRFGLYATTQPA